MKKLCDCYNWADPFRNNARRVPRTEFFDVVEPHFW